MRVALAGSGDLARYICSEFTKAGHQVVVLTRSHKAQFDYPGVTQSVTDYTLESLREPLENCQVLISTISDISPAYVPLHSTLIQACQQSPSCKRFIPSEFAGDVRTYPDQPGFYYSTREPIRKVLREQTDVEWTIICFGWMADYFVPSANRYIKDIGNLHPLDHSTREMIIPGSGNEHVDFTWARDVAKALVALSDAPSWEPYTFLSGERSSWNNMARLIAQKYYPELKVEHRSLHSIIEAIKGTKDEDEHILADYHLFSISYACSVPDNEVQAQRKKYFGKVPFRTVEEGLNEFDNDHSIIV